MSLKYLIMPAKRRKQLKHIWEEKGFVRIIETHNGLSGLIANDAHVTSPNGCRREFDGFWESSLTDSAAKGYPDVEISGN